MVRSERSALLASKKSQVTLKIFKADEFAALELRPPAPDRFFLVRGRIVACDQPAGFGRKILAQRRANQAGAAAMLAACRVVDFRQHLFRDADRNQLTGHACLPLCYVASTCG